MNIIKEQDKAAGEIVELIANRLGKNRQIHPATAISAGARLAGSFIFRSFNLNLKDIEPGSPILSVEANEKGPVLIDVLVAALSNYDLNLDNEKINESPKANSDLSFVDTLIKLQDSAHEIMLSNKLSFEQMAYACAMATAFIIKECKSDLSPETSFNTAIYGFIEGTKTYPPESGSKIEKKNFFKFWK